MREELRLLKDKVDHLQESLNFVCKRINDMENFEPIGASRFGIGREVYWWECGDYYNKGVVLDKTWHVKDHKWHYYIKRTYSSLTGSNEITSWHYEENLIFASLHELKLYLHDRIDKYIK